MARINAIPAFLCQNLQDQKETNIFSGKYLEMSEDHFKTMKRKRNLSEINF